MDMPKRDFYRILGVGAGAAPADIKRAYRRIAFRVHPDVGNRPDAERFREIHEAYEVLSDPDRRRSYDLEVSGRRRPLSAEPLRPRAPVTIPDDFLALRPFIQELLDQIERSLMGDRAKSRGAIHRVGVDAILEADEARFGCRVPFGVPSFVRCPRCGGSGFNWWGFCANCNGRGKTESSHELVLAIPPGTRDGDRFEIDLDLVGISNLLLEVRIIVP
jgi:molecular chaperone DnaJ